MRVKLTLRMVNIWYTKTRFFGWRLELSLFTREMIFYVVISFCSFWYSISFYIFLDNFSAKKVRILVSSSSKWFTLQSWSISRQALINTNISSPDHYDVMLLVSLDFDLPRPLLFSNRLIIFFLNIPLCLPQWCLMLDFQSAGP